MESCNYNSSLTETLTDLLDGPPLARITSTLDDPGSDAALSLTPANNGLSSS